MGVAAEEVNVFHRFDGRDWSLPAKKERSSMVTPKEKRTGLREMERVEKINSAILIFSCMKRRNFDALRHQNVTRVEEVVLVLQYLRSLRKYALACRLSPWKGPKNH